MTIMDDRVQTLLLPTGNGLWMLPGRVVAGGQDLDESAQATLLEQTQMPDAYIEQLYTVRTLSAISDHREIAVCYYALVQPDRLRELPSGPAQWHSFDNLRFLEPEQRPIARMAHARLASKLGYSTIAFQLMPPVFTLSSLQRVYEVIGNEALDKRNFRKRILALGCVRDTGRLRRSGSHRPARLYEYVAPGELHYIG